MFNAFSGHEEAFAQWRRDGYPGTKPETYGYIDFLSDPANDQAPRPGTLWPHQWEAFLRTVYSHEVLGAGALGGNGLLLNIATGGGKTAVIAALTAWLRYAHHVGKFVILCPNLIVRDRLEDDFQGGKVFKVRNLVPNDTGMTPDDFQLATLGSGKDKGLASLLGATVILGNIHQFYQTHDSGKSNLSGLMNGPKFAIFNDEAHNSPAEEYEATLRRLGPQTVLRVDTTATPDRADGQHPDSAMIYEYSVTDALADRIVKSPVVYQPNIETVQLTYTDPRTGERKGVEEINWDDVDRLGLSATQWVTDPKPMQQQMAIALKRLEEQERRAKGRWQPVLFVVAVCKKDAENAADTLERIFKIKTLLVTEDSPEEDRKRATELGREKKSGKPYKAVVSVLMLREGWDVPEVGVILLLRKFSSRVYGQQVIGRGLRRVRGNGIEEAEPQICAVVDHPKLEHAWLWEIFGSRVRDNVLLDDVFDEKEDLPEPPRKVEIARPEKMIPVPDATQDDGGDFQLDGIPDNPEPAKNWRVLLAGIVYEFNVKVISEQRITGVTEKELGSRGWTSVHSAPTVPVGDASLPPRSDEQLRANIKDGVRRLAEDLTEEAGYATAFVADVYGALMAHVREKFLQGHSVGLADRADLETADRMLGQVRERTSGIPGLIAGIIEHAD